MYFEIENTPEHIRRPRNIDVTEDVPEEIPRLNLAPFSKTPQIVFENVRIGTSCEKVLEIANTTKLIQEIYLDNDLPPGLAIQLPAEWIVLKPETCYCLQLIWTPRQPTAVRKTIRFLNRNRGRFDVNIVLKTYVPDTKVKRKSSNTSPGKIKKKKFKTSPVTIRRREAEILYNNAKTRNIAKPDQSAVQYNVLRNSNKENIQSSDYPLKSNPTVWPFDSPTGNTEINFDTSEIFSNFRKIRDEQILHETYDKTKYLDNPNTIIPRNNTPTLDMFDNLTFTPLKNDVAKNEKPEKKPKIVITRDADGEFNRDFVLEKQNKENEPQSIIYTRPTQPLNIDWFDAYNIQNENQYIETPSLQNKRKPNTSSPKELHSPNFSINTELSRISDLSFFPQKFSTEKKVIHKINDTHELIDDGKLNSDTYTKDSPYVAIEQFNFPELRPSQVIEKQPKLCRQALFVKDNNQREYERYNFNRNYCERPFDIRSPPRAMTPPLQSIPEESTQFGDTQRFNITNTLKTTFTINKTFDKAENSGIQTWSKKAANAEPELWKVPICQPKKSLKSKTSVKKSTAMSDVSFKNNTLNNSLNLSQVGSVYSQSLTIDPFLSSTYYYDERAVRQFENEFKKWLNYILTPPADLDSNDEQKTDIGKTWIENRIKDIPLAPTKELVSSQYHNSHRLDSVRKAAKSLFFSPEISQIFQKLHAQIEKKLISIRNDKSLHLDVGLQKMILEILMSYNPLWLRIGLETTYGLVLPLRSNSDIEGLTSFIIQRMFRNPNLKNKHSKTSAPNMLLPAYVEALKKFTLKKFFMLVYFLDQAKEKQLIPHDPCLFRRNAVCKESREIIIRFTKELMAGSGDITKHLRPLGYVLTHKQSYLDEFKYAVHNIAVDIRDGVRLTKVLEIILMRKGLMSQLRTPAISRLQKIHNVEVALNALREADFVIVGDITATDIASGHREKTLSLLWQLIHVFRAPLFEKAANVIQIWWRKKYEVIVEKKKAEMLVRQRLDNAARKIQFWWRKIQYNRKMALFREKMLLSVIIIQKYSRRWIYRTRFLKLKESVRTIESWYRDVKLKMQAKNYLEMLRKERIMLQNYSATIVQSYIRRWLCVQRYRRTVKRIIQLQSLFRMIIQRQQFEKLKNTVKLVEARYVALLKMRVERRKYLKIQECVTVIQSYYRSYLLAKSERKSYIELRNATICIQRRFRALVAMRRERLAYIKLTNTTLKIQKQYRATLIMRRCRLDFQKLRSAAIQIQRRFRARNQMIKQRSEYEKLKNSTLVIQKAWIAYILEKRQKQKYLEMKRAAIKIQNWWRYCKKGQEVRQQIETTKEACIFVQRVYRAYIIGRNQRREYLRIKTATVCIQNYYRSYIEMKTVREQYIQLKTATVTIQKHYRSLLEMKKQRQLYLQTISATRSIQNSYRQYRQMKIVRHQFLNLKRVTINIQRRFRCLLATREERERFLKFKSNVIMLQQKYRALLAMRCDRDSFKKLKTATIIIQTRFRSILVMREERKRFLTMKSTVIMLQAKYRALLAMRNERQKYKAVREATIAVQRRFRCMLAMREERCRYLILKGTVTMIQRKYRALKAMRKDRQAYIKLQAATTIVQRRFRCLLAMREDRNRFLKLKNTVIMLQRKYRALIAMRRDRQTYKEFKAATIVIQRRFRCMLAMREERRKYLILKGTVVMIQRKYRALKAMRRDRQTYKELRAATILVQRKFRFKRALLEQRTKACITIQRAHRAYVLGKKQRAEYIHIRSKIILIQRWFRSIMEKNTVRRQYLKLREAVVLIQKRFKTKRVAREAIRNESAHKIQLWYRSYQMRDKYRREFLMIKKNVITVQSMIRMHIVRKQFKMMRESLVTLQRYYRSYRLMKNERLKYKAEREKIIKCQATIKRFIQRRRYLKIRCAVLVLQAAYRAKKRREEAAREKLQVQEKMHWAASKIQALFRGHSVRTRVPDKRVDILRDKWRQGGLQSSQETSKDRYIKAKYTIVNSCDIYTVIKAFQEIDYLLSVLPHCFENDCSDMVELVYLYMTNTSRSISSIELLKVTASILVRLSRHKSTGPKIYERTHISPILTFMLRYSNNEQELFCILASYLWFFSKYDTIKKDLTEFLNMTDNKKLLLNTKRNVERHMNMIRNARKTPFVSGGSVTKSLSRSSSKITLKPTYETVNLFDNSQQAIERIFSTYKLM